ncbi:hypothetical protein C7I87_26855 [Mesorhizobium sp. SARCC-RB16n]|uniref:hypothetical protein n=1 Tax=Mesorhizobium sp. SARCC-RB16n TaxID=2116687 RepID=UPI00122F69CC|nr:hypothetical protein [Mesorhizobium sp. SARCC-RB16n]KAA3447471.1 hypothetical protein C7I87_26855 [Mesorhizobium sp. SARCC-RB16n]
MDISSARLASLLVETMTPQAVPSAKADPAKAALVKALVQPPAPSLLAQQTAPVLLALPSTAMAAKVQQIASAGIVEAYLAQAEPADGADATPTAAAVARRSAQDVEAQKGLTVPLVKAENGDQAGGPAAAGPAAVTPMAPAWRQASNQNIPAKRGQTTSRPNGMPEQNSERLLLKVAFVSATAGLLGAAAFGLALRMFS